MTRLDVARVLGRSRASVERLVADGTLTPIGRRGKADVFDASAVARLARQQAQPPRDVVGILDYRARTEDLVDRHRELVRTWVPAERWQPLWARAVRAVARVTATWPQRLVTRLGRVTDPTEQAHLDWADGPYLAGHTYPAPIMRPLLEGLGDRLTADFRPLMHLLADVPDVALPAPPTTVDAARRQFREVRAQHRLARILARRGHHRRAQLVEAVADAAERFKYRWWNGRHLIARQAGAPAAVRAAARKLRDDALAEFAKLGGLADTPPRSSRPPRAATRRRK